MLVNILGEKLKATDNITGRMETLIPVSFTTVKSMDRATGKRVAHKILINIKVVIHMMRNMAMVNSFGLQVVNTKETMFTMLRKAMVKCTGLMEVYTEDSGKMEYKLVLAL